MILIPVALAGAIQPLLVGQAIYVLRKENTIYIFDDLTNELKSYGVQVIYKKMSATNEEKRLEVMEELKNINNINIKVFVHSLAFGTLKPMIADDTKNMLNQKNIEMTIDVMANSIIYWTQNLVLRQQTKPRIGFGQMPVL